MSTEVRNEPRATFAYRAIDADGRESVGTLSAASPHDVARKLRSEGKTVLAIGRDEAIAADARVASTSRANRARRGDLAALCRHLGTMSDAGVPISEALAAAAQEGVRPEFRPFVAALAADVESGIPLSTAFTRRGREVPTIVVISAIVVIIGSIVLHRTRFGMYTYAVGSNPEACRRVGIKVDRQLIFVYMIAGACAGIGGILSLAFFQQTTIGGQSMTALTVIAGVVIGGTSLFGGVGSIFGTVIGLLIPAVLQTGFVIIGVESYWQGVVIGIFLIGAVYVDGARRTKAQRGSGRKTKHLQVGGVHVGASPERVN